jgi:hypothetical protein
MEEIEINEVCSICLDYIEISTTPCNSSTYSTTSSISSSSSTSTCSSISGSDTYTSHNSVNPYEIFTLNCNHSFHRNCIISWFIYRQKFICPLCKNCNFIVPVNILEETKITYPIYNKKSRLRSLVERYRSGSNGDGNDGGDADEEENRIVNRRHFRVGFFKFCILYLITIGVFMVIVYLIFVVSDFKGARI